jgi:hypothetical protein
VLLFVYADRRRLSSRSGRTQPQLQQRSRQQSAANLAKAARYKTLASAPPNRGPSTRTRCNHSDIHFSPSHPVLETTSHLCVPPYWPLQKRQQKLVTTNYWPHEKFQNSLRVNEVVLISQTRRLNLSLIASFCTGLRKVFQAKGPAADAMDAPQPSGLLWWRRLLFPSPFNRAPVELNWEGKTEVRGGEKKLSQCHFFHQKSHRTDLESNTGLYGDRPATNCLIQDKRRKRSPEIRQVIPKGLPTTVGRDLTFLLRSSCR